MGGTHQGPTAERLLCERAARCNGGGFPGQVWHLFRDDRRTGLCLSRRRRYMGADCARLAGRAFSRSADIGMIRVELPQHLRTLAKVGREVQLEISGAVTTRSVLDALEARYPMLQGTIRDHVTLQRRPFLRFFACEEDLTHEPPDAPLPDAVASGKEPFIVLGAIAGG